MRVGVSLRQGGILTTRNGVSSQHSDSPTTRLPNSRCAQDQGHTRQRKALRGYEHVGAAVSPSSNHTNTTQHKRKGRGPNPCIQVITCGQVSSRALCIGKASLGSLPCPHKVFLKSAKFSNLNLCMQATLPSRLTITHKSNGHAWLQGI